MNAEFGRERTRHRDLDAGGADKRDLDDGDERTQSRSQHPADERTPSRSRRGEDSKRYLDDGGVGQRVLDTTGECAL
ncbi:hypothetical protein [Brevibacterium samyangense]|uniref:hypothetical protein n=1 Tax=Brevibacterium samyangense TaxID=366888 RepID=UPI0031DA624F